MSPRTQTQPLNDKKMLRQLKARTHPDLGGSEELFVWTSALAEAVETGRLGGSCEHGCAREATARETGRAEGKAEAAAENTTHQERQAQQEKAQNVKDRVPFDGGVPFEELTKRALSIAEEVEEPYAALLRLLEDCEPSPLHASEQSRGASYKSLAALGHKAQMPKSQRVAWYRIAESVPLSQRHVGHIISRIGEEG